MGWERPCWYTGGLELDSGSPISSKRLPGWSQGDTVFPPFYWEEYLMQD